MSVRDYAVLYLGARAAPGQTAAGGNVVVVPGTGTDGEPVAEAHVADLTDAHAASAVSFSPTGTIAATDAQAAIAEVASEAAAALAGHTADTTDAHDASAISIVDAGGHFTATDVEAALQEIATGGPGGGGDTVGQFIVGYDGGLSNLVAGHAQDVIAPYTGTLTRWTILGDATGAAVIDVATDTYAGYPSFTSIVAADPPTLSGAIKAQSSTLTGWTVAVTAGDLLRFTLSSVSGLRRLLLVLDYTRP